MVKLIKVDNKKTIYNITKKYMKENKRRNGIIILAIILTSLMLTSVFTISGILIKSIENENFRQVGSEFHGAFKFLNLEEVEELKTDSLINKYGIRRILGLGVNDTFNKSQVEISYIDENNAYHSFARLEVGRLPNENTKEVACDTGVLDLLGIEKEIGKEVFLKIRLGNGETIEDTFTLVGWWEYDEALFSNQVLVPLSYLENALVGYDRIDPDMTGTYDLNIFLDNSKNIEEKLNEIASNHGFQVKDPNGEKFLDIGVNWGYLNSVMEQKNSIEMIVSIIFFVLIIAISGYMIIYNIFQISVLQDIKFYGLLKTIGTTKKQIRKIILTQALILAVIGIPIGLGLGLLVGNILSDKIVGLLINVDTIYNIDPLNLIISIIFSLVIVLLSARRPGIIAGKVSPVEAVKYVEKDNFSTNKNRKTLKHSILNMSLANLKRNKKKTIISAISIALALVLFQGTINISKGFDEEKYLTNFVVSDFVLGNASYFNNTVFKSDKERSILESEIEEVKANVKIQSGGKINVDYYANIALTEEEFISYYGENYREYLDNFDRTPEGKIHSYLSLYGFNNYLLDKLIVFEGSIEDLKNTKNGIIALYKSDDYGKPEPDSNLFEIGDKVEIYKTKDTKYINTKTQEEISDLDEINSNDGEVIEVVKDFQREEYEVVCKAMLKHPMSLRYSGPLAFVLKEEDLYLKTSGVGAVAYIFDVEEDNYEKAEEFLFDYTNRINKNANYESKNKAIENFEGLKNTFYLVSFAFTFVLGLIGVLNFLNSIVTSIISRKREFAILKAIGMTDRQIKKMLIIESLFYVFISGVIAFLITAIINNIGLVNLENLLWFYSARDKYGGLLILMGTFVIIGILISTFGYKLLNKESIVDRLNS